MSAVLTEMIQILTAGITGIATGVGSGLQALATNIFLDTTKEGAPALSVFGGAVCIFGGIGLSIGLCTLIVKWVMSLGARN